MSRSDLLSRWSQPIHFLNFFCKTMLPHQGYSRPENPKRHGFDSSIKLSPLQNYGIMNLQNHRLSDTISIACSEKKHFPSLARKKSKGEGTIHDFFKGFF